MFPRRQNDSDATDLSTAINSQRTNRQPPLTLQGVLNSVDVILHVWIRIVAPNHLPQPPACAALSETDRNALGCSRFVHVKGAAFLQDHQKSVPYKSPMIQMVQSSQMAHFVGRKVYLR